MLHDMVITVHAYFGGIPMLLEDQSAVMSPGAWSFLIVM